MSSEDAQLIEDYLRGSLPESEIAEFQKRLNKDAAFKQAFDLEKKLFESLNEDTWSFITEKQAKAVQEYGEAMRDATAQKLKKNIELGSEAYHHSGKRINWFRYAAVASIALLFVIYSVFVRSDSPEEIYSKYIDLDGLPSLVSRQQTTDSLAFAQQFFEEKNYQKALPIFSNAIELDTNNATLYLYKGIAQTQLSRYEEAMETFDTLIRSDLIDAPKGKWYKALLFIKMAKMDEAKNLLKEIENDQSFNYQQAKKLLKKI